MAETALKRDEGRQSSPPPSRLHCRPAARPEGTCRRNQACCTPPLWREALVLAPLAVLLPRVVLPGGIRPALAIIIAMSLLHLEHLPLYAGAVFLSLAAQGGSMPEALAAVPALILATYLGRGWSGSRRIFILASTLSLAILGKLLINDQPWPGAFWLIAFEALGTAFLSLLYAKAIPLLKEGPLRMGLDERRLTLAIFTLALALYPLGQVEIGGFNLAPAGAAFAVALLGYLLGPLAGALMGLFAALLPQPVLGGWPIAAGLALSGILVGLFRRHRRGILFLALLGGFALAMLLQWPASSPPLSTIAPLLFGAGVFLALPHGLFRQLMVTLPSDTAAWEKEKRAEQIRLRRLLGERVSDFAAIFSQLSMAFSTREETSAASSTGARDLYSLIDAVVGQTCRPCNGFETCWEKNFYTSYRELFDLMALAEMSGAADPSHLHGRLAENCFQQRRLLETVGSLLGHAPPASPPPAAAAECRNFVAGQLEGVANIMANLAAEVHLDLEFRLEVEERLRSSFNRLGLAITSLSVLEYGQDMLEIKIAKHGCLNLCECQYLIAPMVSRLLGHSFRVWERRCPREPGQECCFTLLPAGRFQVRHAVGRLGKDPEFCGDNNTLAQTKDGRLAIILSDGMGSGRKAAQESKATVNLLSQLISSGVTEEFALNLINSVLMLRTPEERFATVDVALIDVFSGRAELIKIGAAPGYIKRGREVIAIRAQTPPAGILERVEIFRQQHDLCPGDYLIMVSDGIFSGTLGPEEAEDWVEKALARVEVAGPQPMVDFLLKIAQANMGAEVKDDVTVIVLQLLAGE